MYRCYGPVEHQYQAGTEEEGRGLGSADSRQEPQWWTFGLDQLVDYHLLKNEIMP
jgi:hypothetical protein